LNSYLDKIKAGATASHTLLCWEGAEITSEAIKSKYLSKAEKTYTICEAIKIHNKNMEELVEKDGHFTPKCTINSATS